MLETLAKINGYSAKAIYLVIRFYGTATFQDLLTAGFGESTIYDVVKQLQEQNLIFRVGKGVYRVASTSTGAEFSRSIAGFEGL